MQAIRSTFFKACTKEISEVALNLKLEISFIQFLPADDNNGEGHSIGGGLLLLRIRLLSACFSGVRVDIGSNSPFFCSTRLKKTCSQFSTHLGPGTLWLSLRNPAF